MTSIFDFLEEKADISGVDEAVFYSLFKGNNLVLNEDVDDDSIGRLINQIQVLAANNKAPITIRINTDGGCVYNFLRLYDVCKAVKNKIIIVAEGKAFSAGAFIVACCGDNSYCHKNTSFMIHQVSGWSYGTTSTVETALEEQKRVQKIIFKLLVNHTRLKQKDIDRFNKENKDWWFDAQEALACGIVRGVL